MTSLWITPLKFIYQKKMAKLHTPFGERNCTARGSYTTTIRTDDDLYVGVMYFGFWQESEYHEYCTAFNPGQHYTPK